MAGLTIGLGGMFEPAPALAGRAPQCAVRKCEPELFDHAGLDYRFSFSNR